MTGELLAVVLFLVGAGLAQDTVSQCDLATRHIVAEDQATVTDESPTRLNAQWMSEDCETRTGPEYMIRKYAFFENGTFQLTRHYYAEESCTVPTHTVTAAGWIKIHGNSLNTPGASEARYHLDTVHIMPLNRQVAYKLSHRVNVSCGPHARWKPYAPQLIYERPPEKASSWQGPKYVSSSHHHHHHVQHHRQHLRSISSPSNKGTSSSFRGKTVDCLAPLNIDFEELRLLRVQRRTMGLRSGSADRLKVQLFLGGLPRELSAKKMHRATSLQATPLLRSDTIQDCPTCGLIARGKDNSPPLLVQRVTLPALLGGSWISPACESQVGGVWLRRHFEIYGGDKLWTGQWDYFTDPRCNNFLYAISAAGSYVQRPARRTRRHTEEDEEDVQESTPESTQSRSKRQAKKPEPDFGFLGKMLAQSNQDRPAYHPRERLESMKILRSKRSLDEIDYYRHLLQTAQPSMAESFAAMLRGNQRHEETTKKPPVPMVPMGTTEVDLHVAESLMIVGDVDVAQRCGAAYDEDSNSFNNPRLSSWPSDCVPHSLDAPSTIGLRARIGIDWYGGYTLQLGSRDSALWDEPLLQCGATTLKNPVLRSHLRRSVGIKFGLFSASSGNVNYGMKAVLAVMLCVTMFFSAL